MYYMGSRYYDPETMNFIQKDSILGEEERPETLNRYGYVQGNPILYEDPEGRSAVFAFGGIAMAAYQATKTIFKKQAQAKTIAETLQNPLQSSMVRNKDSSISSSKQVIAAGSGKQNAALRRQVSIVQAQTKNQKAKKQATNGINDLMGQVKSFCSASSAKLIPAESVKTRSAAIISLGAEYAAPAAWEALGYAMPLLGTGVVLKKGWEMIQLLSKANTKDPDAVQPEGEKTEDKEGNEIDEKEEKGTEEKAEGEKVEDVDQDKIYRSAKQPKKGGETVAGHALQKHAGRNPDIWGKVSGNSDKINEAALRHIKEILEGSGQFKKVISNGRTFLEKMLPDKRGVRLNLDGTFKGFIDQVR